MDAANICLKHQPMNLKQLCGSNSRYELGYSLSRLLAFVEHTQDLASGLGKRTKVFEIGEVIQLDAKRKEFCE